MPKERLLGKRHHRNQIFALHKTENTYRLFNSDY